MSEINIPPKMWRDFLETFSGRHAGWLVHHDVLDVLKTLNVLDVARDEAA